MYLGQEFAVFGNWFIIHFTENNGMAFGLELAGEWGKLALTSFRIIAVIGIGWYLRSLILSKGDKGFIICVSMIFAGAIGNIIDSVFYGVIFNESMFQLATFLPAEGGYAGFLEGRVVDMFYFPLIEGNFPSWFPLWGGEHFLFFRLVFNIADSAITVGITLIVIFQKRFFEEQEPKPAETEIAEELT